MPQKIKFLIGGMVFELKAAEPSLLFKVNAAYLPFEVEDGETDVSLTVRPPGIPSWEGNLIFDPVGPWKLWRSGKKHAITVHNLSPQNPHPEKPFQVAFLDEDFSVGDLYADQDLIIGSDYFPFSYPLDELITLNRLACGFGIEVHACGVNDRGQGIIFLGESGAGKSTLSGIWQQEPDVRVLSDDRIIITKDGDTFWIHGTPWHGEAGIADPSKAPLKAVFFLQQAPENLATRMSVGHATTQLLVRSFPTFWNREGMQFSTDIASDIAYKTPCYDLSFLPEKSVIDCVRDIL